MRKVFFGVFLISSLFFLTACPFFSEYSLSDVKQSEIDTLLVGDWEYNKSKKNGDKLDLLISPLDKNTHQILVRSTEKGKVQIDTLFGFYSVINGEKIMNIYHPHNSTGYNYYKYEVRNDHLKLAYATDDYITTFFKSREELQNFFETNINRNAMFGKKMLFKRKSIKK